MKLYKAVRVVDGEFRTPLNPVLLEADPYAHPVTWIPGEWVDYSAHEATVICSSGVLHCATSLPSLSLCIEELFGYAEYAHLPTIHVFRCEADEIIGQHWMDRGYKVGARKMRIVGSAKYVVESNDDYIPLGFTFKEIVE